MGRRAAAEAPSSSLSPFRILTPKVVQPPLPRPLLPQQCRWSTAPSPHPPGGPRPALCWRGGENLQTSCCQCGPVGEFYILGNAGVPEGTPLLESSFPLQHPDKSVPISGQLGIPPRIQGLTGCKTASSGASGSCACHPLSLTQGPHLCVFIPTLYHKRNMIVSSRIVA